MTTAVTTTSVDAITARVIGGRLTSIAEEMSTKLIRMGFSILIKESEDIGCALLDAEGWHDPPVADRVADLHHHIHADVRAAFQVV